MNLLRRRGLGIGIGIGVVACAELIDDAISGGAERHPGLITSGRATFSVVRAGPGLLTNSSAICMGQRFPG